MVSDVSVTANRRNLLSGVRVSYIVTVASDQTTDYLVMLLHASASSGSFAAMMSAKSGIPIRGTSIYAVYNLSLPASSLRFSSKSGEELLTDKGDKEYANATVSFLLATAMEVIFITI